MTGKLAVFRCDASREIGGGHIQRCLVLADALAECGWTSRFLTRAASVDTVPRLELSGHEVVAADTPDPDDPTALAAIAKEGCDLLVVDHYRIDADYEAACRRFARNIMVIDDLADRPHDCDLLLDQTLGRVVENYRPYVSDDCRFLLGPGFALLRGQFASARERALRRRSAASLRRVLVGFGAADGRGLSSIALHGLFASRLGLKVDIVIGAIAPALPAVRELAAREPEKVRVHVGVDNVAELMTRADLAIGACGSMSWERCCVGLPALGIVTSENQKLLASELESAGAIELLGLADTVTSQDISDHLVRLYEQPDALLRMSQESRGLCDGRGAARVAQALSECA